MNYYKIEIYWDGPFTLNRVINEMNDSGQSPEWDGKDYGLYQIYGRHILYGKGALLYVGKATRQTFSQRMKQHKKWWLGDDQNEKDVSIYVGRIYNPRKHSVKDKWKSWEEEVEIAEGIIIYKYSPCYNGRTIFNKSAPNNIRLVHIGEKGRLKNKDVIPRDYDEW